MKRTLFAASLLLLPLLHPQIVHSHNGSMAIVVPVEGITIDGDLSDWPVGVEWHPVAVLGA